MYPSWLHIYIVQTSDTSTNTNTIDDQRIRCSQATCPNPTQLTLAASPTPASYAYVARWLVQIQLSCYTYSSILRWCSQMTSPNPTQLLHLLQQHPTLCLAKLRSAAHGRSTQPYKLLRQYQHCAKQNMPRNKWWKETVCSLVDQKCTLFVDIRVRRLHTSDWHNHWPMRPLVSMTHLLTLLRCNILYIIYCISAAINDSL